MPSHLAENGKGPLVPFLIGVSGGTSSGKTSVCQEILKRLKASLQLDDDSVAIISQDNFYKDLGEEEIALANKCLYNFDHPDAFDTKLMQKTLHDLAQNRPVCVPEYDFKTHSRLKGEFTKLSKCKVVLFEGILTFYHMQVRDMFDMKLFVDSDADTRLSRRVLRDISERGRELESVLSQYTKFVKPAFEEFCLPTKKYADVIIPRGAENTVAINLIVQHIRDILTGGLHVSMHNGHHQEALHCNGTKKAIAVNASEVANTARPH